LSARADAFPTPTILSPMLWAILSAILSVMF
jgi:hypothetical protein